VKKIQGYTIIELVLILVFVGVLSGYVATKMSTIHEDARIASIYQEWGEIKRALYGDDEFRGYIALTGDLPPDGNLDELLTAQGTYSPFAQAGESTSGAMVTIETVTDPWGQRYVWDRGGGNGPARYGTIKCLGSDGIYVEADDEEEQFPPRGVR